jgi:hypothetical protein
MSRASCSFLALLLVVLIATPAFCQSQSALPSPTDSSGNPLVTAIAARDQVRFTVLALSQKIRLEVLSQTGEPLFDSGLQPGNRLEWQAKDQQGSDLRDGVYGCLVTVADLYGQVSQRRAIFRVNDGAVSFDMTNREPAAAADGQENLTILRADEPSPFTLVSHDGNEGWIESASGGLSFYVGSLSRSRDSVPHLRLTPEGNLGVGVSEPTAKLDVAGVIRASEGFQFSDGTVLKMDGGLPVLVMDSSAASSDGKARGVGVSSVAPIGNTVGKNVRVLVSGAIVDRHFGNELGSNTYYGDGAGASITDGMDNSFFGLNAGNKTNGSVPFGSYNSFFGSGAGSSNTTGYSNSFFGQSSGKANTAGYANSFFGYNAGQANTTGTGNTFVGRDAGYLNDTASNNSFFGSGAGSFNTTGTQNSFFGRQAGASNTTGNSNSFFGYTAGYSNTEGYSNVFFGDQAGYFNTTGTSNVFVGRLAGNQNTSGTTNTFVGNQAGQANTTGSGNAFFGSYAGQSNTTGTSNSFFGRGAGYLNTTGGGNSFFGRSAGYYNTTGFGNSFFGQDAGSFNTTGSANSFFGQFAAYNNTTGTSNSVFGYMAGNSNTTGNYNSFFGTQTGQLNTTGANDSFFGLLAGYNNTTGGSNSFVGLRAGWSNTIEHNNSFFGASSDGAAGITNATALGYRAKVTQSNSLVLGSINGVNGANADTNVGIGTTAPKGRLDVAGPLYSSAWGPLTGSGVALMYDSGGPWGMLLSYDSVADHALDFAFRALTIDFRTGYWGNNIAMHVTDPGNVGIGTTTPQEKLHVIGNIRASGSITANVTSPEEELPDYVFEQDYNLMPLEDLEKFVAKEKHLPNIPAASEIKEKGLNLGEFQMRLLEKVEELTLYTVQQGKANREQATALERKDAEIATLNARLAAVEQILAQLARPEQK